MSVLARAVCTLDRRPRKCFVYDAPMKPPMKPPMKLGPVGVWLGGYGFAAEDDRANAIKVERLGYSALWFGEAPGGKEAFVRGDDVARRDAVAHRRHRHRQHLGA